MVIFKFLPANWWNMVNYVVVAEVNFQLCGHGGGGIVRASRPPQTTGLHRKNHCAECEKMCALVEQVSG